MQREAIPPILDGNDVLISSATASGKTEAACATFLERMLHCPGNWTVLYHSTTRALVNDLYARLKVHAARLHIRVVLCAESERDMLIQEAMLEAAREGFLGDDLGGSHYAVWRQQIASYIFQSPTTIRSGKMLHQLFQHEAEPQEIDQLLHLLIAQEELVESPNGIGLGPNWLELASSGEIHSNIETAVGQTVINERTGEKIAKGVRFARGE